jgi:hypothetical protein
VRSQDSTGKGENMKAGIKKTASGKAMRVATIFTGAAACAAAFTPAAVAGTAHTGTGHAGTDHQAPLGGNVVTPDHSRVRPANTTEGNCASTATWVHFFGAGQGAHCFGGRGSWDSGVIKASKICGGNNYGSYYGFSDNGNGSPVGAGFGPGTTFVHLPWAGLTDVSAVIITKWKGSDTCGAP